MLLLVFLLFFSFNLPSQAAPNPWVQDPLAKINLFSSNKQVLQQTSPNAEPQTSCAEEDKCLVCETVEEWALDFDGDDLAEKAQKRECTFDKVLGFKPQMIIIYDSQLKPIIYKSNTNSCKKKTQMSYSSMQRVDFNKDNFDELLLIERNEAKQNEEVTVLGYNTSSNKIAELPVIEYETDLQDKLKSNINSDELKVSFDKLNGTIGFIVTCTTPADRAFQVYYFQDSSDRGFYPLRIVERRKPVFSASEPKETKPNAIQ